MKDEKYVNDYWRPRVLRHIVKLGKLNQEFAEFLIKSYCPYDQRKQFIPLL